MPFTIWPSLRFETAVPLALAMATIGPLDGAIQRYAIRAARPEPAIAKMVAGNAEAVRQRFADAAYWM